jgi:hypothetical protein
MRVRSSAAAAAARSSRSPSSRVTHQVHACGCVAERQQHHEPGDRERQQHLTRLQQVVQCAEHAQCREPARHRHPRAGAAPRRRAQEEPETQAEQQVEDRVEAAEHEQPHALRRAGGIGHHLHGLRDVDEDDPAQCETA